MVSNMIVLRGKGHHDEGVLGTVAAPGELIELQADGKFDRLVSTALIALKGGMCIVKEDALQSRTVLDALAIGDTVSYYIPIRGDIVQLLIKSGEDIDIGDDLIPVIVTGQFVEAAGTEVRFSAVALEDSGGVLAAATLLRCRIL